MHGPVPDVAVVAWGRNTMLVLALDGRGGHGIGWGKAVRQAQRAARRACPGKGTSFLPSGPGRLSLALE
jgi:hypothetical protein